jgi:hypothetical protein
MDKKDHRFACRATLSAKGGQERLATRAFAAIDEAADWALVTAQKLKAALGAESFGKIDDAIEIEISGQVPGDPEAKKTVIFAGTIAAATAQLSERVRAFESTELPQLQAESAKRAAARRKRKILAIGGGAALLAIAAGTVAVMPPILDPEVAADKILSAPPPGIAGRWALGNGVANCETNFVEFDRRRYDAVVGASKQSFAAGYSQPTPDTMRVEYAQGGIKLIQTFRLTGEPGRMIIASIESSEAEIQNAARRAVGTLLSKCPPAGKP